MTELRRLLRGLGRADLVPFVPRVVRAEPRVVVPTAAELEALRRCPDARLRMLILLCSEAGLRAGTAVRVEWAHIDLLAGLLTVPTKWGTVAAVPVTARLRAALDATPRTADRILTCLNRQGTDGRYRHFSTRFKAWRQQCGITRKLTLHDLRRGLAQRLYASTGDLHAVRSLLSHRHLATTLHYLDNGRKPVSADALERVTL